MLVSTNINYLLPENTHNHLAFIVVTKRTKHPVYFSSDHEKQVIFSTKST